MAVAVLACVWMIWWSAPQWPVRIVQIAEPCPDDSDSFIFFYPELNISPDGRLYIISEPSSDGLLDKVGHTILKWIGLSVSRQTSYRVIDLANGQTVNRFVTADRPRHFDVDSQSVWCYSSMSDRRKKSLAALSAALGGAALVAVGRNGRRRDAHGTQRVAAEALHSSQTQRW